MSVQPIHSIISNQSPFWSQHWVGVEAQTLRSCLLSCWFSRAPPSVVFFVSYFSVVAETAGHERKLSLSLYLPSASPPLPLPPLQLMSLKQMNFWVPPALRKPPTKTFPPFPPTLGFITPVQLISYTIQSAVACRYIMTAADDDFRY